MSFKMTTEYRTIQYRVCGLDYVYIIDAPIKKNGSDEYIDLNPEGVELAIAKEILLRAVPLRGREVVFLRKALQMNRNQWAKALGMTAAGVKKWEDQSDKKLNKVNSMVVRLFCAESLQLDIGKSFSDFVVGEELPEKIEISAA